MSGQGTTRLRSPQSSSESIRHSRDGAKSTLGTFLGVLGPAAAVLVLSGLLAVGVVWEPLKAMAVGGAISVALVARCAPATIERIFLYLMFAGLVGYALLGRTFAGLGVPPVYIGEIILAVGLLSTIANGWNRRLVPTPLIYLLIVFMGWGAIRTIPYLHIYGLNALRDAVVWGYGLFVLLLAPLIVRRNLIERIPTLYSRVFPWILVITPLWVIVGELAARMGASVTPKPGDAGVHLGGAAAFLLAAVPTRRTGGQGSVRKFIEWAAWPVILLGLIAMGSLNRGGLVAALAAILTVLVMLPSRAGGKLLLVVATAVLVATVWLGSGVSIQIRKDRAIDPDQIAENLMSIGGGSGKNLDNTREWRLVWWQAIIDYTIHGKYFWTGKGFGVNLTYDDGIEADPDNPSRSPHNGHLTVLARSGVPGLVLWGAIQIGFALSMVAAFVRARRDGRHMQMALIAWILAYWVAFLMNATFDPYLESPQGGIWFWCVFAYGIALIVSQKRVTQPLASYASVPAPMATLSGRP